MRREGRRERSYWSSELTVIVLRHSTALELGPLPFPFVFAYRFHRDVFMKKKTMRFLICHSILETTTAPFCTLTHVPRREAACGLEGLMVGVGV